MKSWFKDRPKINLLIDATMFVLLMCVAGLGFLIKFVLVPGYERNLLYGRDVELYFLGLDRHKWGSVHMWLNFLFLFLLLLHIILHWKTIVCIFRKMISGNAIRKGIGISIGVTGFILAVGPLFISPEIATLPPNHIGSRSQISHTGKADDDRTAAYKRKNRAETGLNNKILINRTDKKVDMAADSRKDLNDTMVISRAISDRTGNAGDTAPCHRESRTGVLLADQLTDEEQGERLHRNDHAEIEVYGYMTLNEVAGRYHVSIQELAKALNVPVEKSGFTLGKLRKQYNFYMSDVRNIIVKLSE